MKWLAVDYGDSRTGLAGCDAGETITSPITPQIEEKSMNKVAAAVTAVAQARGAEALVCGLPKNMDGTEGSRANKSRRFAQRLANTANLSVVLWDERRTTVSAAAILAETQWGITDPEILSAIRCHTTGKPGMSKLDKIIYLADMTSAERDWPGVDDLRALEMQDLDRALCDALKRSIDFVEEKGGTLDPESVAAYEYAKEHLQEP